MLRRSNLLALDADFLREGCKVLTDPRKQNGVICQCKRKIVLRFILPYLVGWVHVDALDVHKFGRYLSRSSRGTRFKSNFVCCGRSRGTPSLVVCFVRGCHGNRRGSDCTFVGDLRCSIAGFVIAHKSVARDQESFLSLLTRGP